ncbi:MAG: cytochrome c-type biogenesis protein CcmH [bacterium]|nr:cytochrome c-type biogenesis protein CcmH [bacterium]
MIKMILFLLLLLSSGFEIQAQSLEGLSDPDITRVKQLWREIRCPVCSGQAIGESFIETAIKLKQKVVNQVRLGRTNAEILEDFQEEYGPDILFDPQVSGSTFLLWILPWVFLICAGIGIFMRVRRRRKI